MWRSIEKYKLKIYNIYWVLSWIRKLKIVHRRQKNLISKVSSLFSLFLVKTTNNYVGSLFY